MRSLLNRMDKKLDLLLWRFEQMSNTEERILRMSVDTDNAIAAMNDQLAATKAGVDSAVVLLNSIPSLLAASGVPAETIQNFTTTLRANMQPLLDAVAADGPQPAPPGPVVPNPPAPGAAMARAPRGG